MNFTIAECKETSREMSVEVFKDGRKYGVLLAYNLNGESKIRTRIFSTIEKAFELFTLMSKYFVYGLYSTNDRFEIFQNWSGENAETK